MYNRGSFNKQSFNLLGGQENEVSLRETMTATFGSMISHGEDIYEVSYCIEKAEGSMVATAATIYSAELLEEISASIVGTPEYMLSGVLSESVESSVNCGEDCKIVYDLAESVLSSDFIGMNAYYTMPFEANFGSDASAGCDYYDSPILFYAILEVTISSYMFNYRYIVIDVVIPAGSVLVIDSENYNVLLDGENIIDKQSGDWFDELTRNTFDVTIVSGLEGNLTGSLLYKERFL